MISSRAGPSISRGNPAGAAPGSAAARSPGGESWLTTDAVTQRAHVVVDGRQLHAHLLQVFKLGAHESRVGRDRLPHPVHRPRQLVLELLPHDLDQALLQLLCLGVEIALGLTALVRQDEQSETGEETRRQDAGHVDRDVLAAATTSAPSPTAPASATATVATAFRTESASSFASASRS